MAVAISGMIPNTTRHCSYQTQFLSKLRTNRRKKPNPAMLLEADERVTHQLESLCLFGKIQFNPSLNKHDVKRIFAEAWNCTKDFTVSEIGWSVFVFTFADTDDRNKALCRAPWTVDGNLLVLSAWSSGKHPSELNFSNAPFWVRVHGLPLDYFTEKNGLTIGWNLGAPICVDKKVFDEMLVRDKYLRILVFVDITMPLKKGFPLVRSGLPEIWVDVKYEGLPRFCYNCGRIGHGLRMCRQPRRRDKFGPWLKPDISPPEPIAASSYSSRAMMVKQSMEVQPSSAGMESEPESESESESESETNVSRRTLWSKLMIGGIESVAILTNSVMIHKCVCDTSGFEEKKCLLTMVVVAYLMHLILKLTCQVQRSGLFKGSIAARVSLVECRNAAFIELCIFAVLFLKLFSG